MSWREDVEDAARNAIDPRIQPIEDDVEIGVVYYHDEGAPHLPDQDNMLKPIQDALQGIVYINDRQLSDVSCCRRNFDGSFHVRRMSAILATGFVGGEEFIHVVVKSAPNPQVLRQ